MATHFIILAWKIPWTEEPVGLQSRDVQRVGHDWAHTHTHAQYLQVIHIIYVFEVYVLYIYICIYNVLYIFSYTYWNICTHTYKHCISLLLHILFIYSLDLKDFYTFLPNFLALYVLWLLVNLNTFSSSITIYGLLSNSALNILQF